MPQSNEGFIGQSFPRREDKRLLSGNGRYIDDLVLPRMLHVAFVRSPIAHARIRSIDLSRVRAASGVALAITAADLKRELPPVADHRIPMPSKWRMAVKHKITNPRQPLLADKIRYVGEPIAAVVAESRYAAEDAIELAAVDLEPLPAVVDVEAALLPDAPLVHDELGTNLLAEMAVCKGDATGAFARAPHRLRRRFYHHRYAAVPIECRGVVSAYDPRTDVVTAWSSTQMVHMVRNVIAGTLGLAQANVRCVAPDVGGGFGVKGHAYPEDQLIPFLARRLGRPVKWIEDRYEHFLASCHARDQLHDAEIGFDSDGRIIAMRDEFIADSGAFNPIGGAIAYNTVVHMPGPYKIDHLEINARIVATNKTPNAPYRGAGRPEAVQVTERFIDLIASQLGLEAAEVRRRNMIPRDAMPYEVHLPYRDGEPIVYDSGDYLGALEKTVAKLGGIEAFRLRQAEARKHGHYLGLGFGCYTEGTGAGPYESVALRIEPSGKIHVTAGVCSQGQGMETIFAQIAADVWKVRPEDIVVSLGDTAAITTAFGVMASRCTVTVSSAIHFASKTLREKAFAIAANLLECSSEDLELVEGSVGIVGVPGQRVTLGQVAQAARPGWDHGRPNGVEPGLECTHYYEPPTVTWSYAVHGAIVDVDIGTGKIKIERYVVAHDCGITVNPMLVEGQVIGGVAQGIGGVLLEGLHYDAKGQLLTVSLADYALPTSTDVPEIELIHQETPSPLNPLGVKGLGEGGAIAPGVTIANAVCDALAPFKMELNSTPITSEQIIKKIAAVGGL
jgi:aerobic carbon-monoxide dehydrogenase large subunit